MSKSTNYTVFGWEMMVTVPLLILVPVCTFPIYSNRQLTISLWFYNGIQEGDSTILLVVFYCKLYGRVNTVNMLWDVLFIYFLLYDKCAIHIPVP